MANDKDIIETITSEQFTEDDIDRQIIRLSLNPSDDNVKAVAMLYDYKQLLNGYEEWAAGEFKKKAADLYNKGREDMREEIMSNYTLNRRNKK